MRRQRAFPDNEDNPPWWKISCNHCNWSDTRYLWEHAILRANNHAVIEKLRKSVDDQVRRTARLYRERGYPR